MLVEASALRAAARRRSPRPARRDVDEATAEALRIEAGVPQFHRDMDEETIPLEAGIESRAISLTKGCYVGQEVIIRVLHRGHGRVARKLVGLQPVDGGACRSAGATVQARRSASRRGDERDVVARAAAADRARRTCSAISSTPGPSVTVGDRPRDGDGAAVCRAGLLSRPIVPRAP